MSDKYMDEYDHYNYDDKIIHSRGSGKQRTKVEAEQNKVQDPMGHTRKIVTNMQNNEANNKEQSQKALKH